MSGPRENLRYSGNDSQPCADCGFLSMFTTPRKVQVGRRLVEFTLCLRCLVRQQAEG